MDRTVILFGANGRIGRAVLTRLLMDLPAERVKVIPWRGEADDWRENQAVDVATKLKSFVHPSQPASVVFAGGVTDPKVDPAVLLESNVQFPLRVIEALAGQEQFHFFTLGSVFEGDESLIGNNGYLRAKRELFLGLESMRERAVLRGRIHHVRLHTVYGPPFASHMFIDQMARAIKENREFQMSPGGQLREFHYVADVAANLVPWILKPNQFGDWLQEMSAGQAVQLKELAQHVFDALGCSHLLKIGALSAPASENFSRQWEANLNFSRVYRPALSGVTEAIAEFIGRT